MTPFLAALAARRRFGMKPGLNTIRSLAAAIGDPQKSFPAIHVAGTNGKGAVVAMIDAALRAQGEKVGRYISPHLVRLNERFVLNGVEAADEQLDRIAARVAEASARLTDSDVTFFEALTAVAFLLFAEAKVDRAVMECGLGGRLDATNICASELSVITRIGLDHCDWLGSTLEQIAAEKAGIIRPGVPVVLGCNESQVREVIAARAKELGAPFHYAPEMVEESEIPADFALEGGFNRENAVTALAALKVLGVKRSAVERGLAAVIWPGRFQRVGEYLVDGAHNPPGARALVGALTAAGWTQLPLVFAACGDKDVTEVLNLLKPFVASAFAVRTSNPRAIDQELLADKMNALGIAARPCRSIPEALELSKGEKGRPILVCGSLFLAGEALVQLGALAQRSTDPSELLV